MKEERERKRPERTSLQIEGKGESPADWHERGVCRLDEKKLHHKLISDGKGGISSTCGGQRDSVVRKKRGRKPAPFPTKEKTAGHLRGEKHTEIRTLFTRYPLLSTRHPCWRRAGVVE